MTRARSAFSRAALQTLSDPHLSALAAHLFKCYSGPGKIPPVARATMRAVAREMRARRHRRLTR